MGYKRRMVSIDGEKLRKEISVRKLTLDGVSKDLGYGRTFLTNCISRAKIGCNAVQLLELKYNISPDSYTVNDVPPMIVEETTKTFESITKEDLYKIIYSAVYEAVKQALTE